MIAGLWLAAVLVSLPAEGAANAASAEGAAATACAASDAVEASPRALLVALNYERLRAGLPTLRLEPALCTAAAERAATLVRSGSLDADASAIAEVSRRLFALRYRAERWSEQPVLRRGGARAVLDAWRRLDPERFRAALAADVSDFGAASATFRLRSPAGERFEDLPLTLLMFALPRHTAFLRQARALGTPAELCQGLVAAANAERARAGLPALARLPELDRAAQLHAEDLVGRGYYDHRTPEGTGVLERLEASGYRARVAAENLARGPFSPADAVLRWMLSSGHRANLLSPRFDRIGAGVVLDDRPEKEEFTFVLDFAAGEK